LPPHPSPTALVTQFNANMGVTLLYGLMIAIPAIIIAGPLFSKMVKNISAEPLEMFRPQPLQKGELPGTANSFLTSLLPVFLLAGTTILNYFFIGGQSFKPVLTLIGEAGFIMLISVLIAAYTLGIACGRSMKQVMAIYAEAVKDVGMILLIIAGSGALKQVLTDTGVSKEIAGALQEWPVHPLVLAWCMAGIIRICVGSATVAGLTTAGIVAPLLVKSSVNPNLMVLSVGAGSLLFSHVNDAGFWMFKEYFNLSIKDTLKTWSVMETIVAITGLIGVMLLSWMM
jgi:Gnt-I system high-affinity gluconate transporter